MPLVPGREVLAQALNHGYAVGSFNINNLEFLQGITQACAEERSPAFIAVTEGAINYAGLNYLSAIVKMAGNSTDLPLVLHLDHGRNLEVIKCCIEIGFGSVMFDGSALSFDENLRLTREVVRFAHERGVSVEAELGRIEGVEDLVEVKERDAILVDPQAAARFVKETGVDYLAPAIGTVHGPFKFKGEPRLDFERLKRTQELTSIPLVLHGASSVPKWLLELALRYGAQIEGAKGVPEDQIREAIRLGVAKVNVDTDLRLAFLAGLRRVLAETPAEYDPRKILGPARELIKRVVKEKIELFGSAGRA